MRKQERKEDETLKWAKEQVHVKEGILAQTFLYPNSFKQLALRMTRKEV